MAKLISGRLKNLNIGVSSYTENNNVLVATGNATFTGIVTASSFSGSGTNLTGIVTSIVAGSNISISNATGQVTISATAGAFSRTLTEFVATNGQTTFNVSYTVGYIDVFVNGILLSGDEYTATNQTSVVLNEAASSGDIVSIITFGNSSNSFWNEGSNSNIYRLSNVGIGTINPTSKLTVSGDGNFTGVVTAASFSGSGTNLTGIVTSIVAGTNITISPVGGTGQVTINASGGGGGGSTAALDILEVMLFA